MADPVDFSALAGRVNFYFVRHGESESNRERIMQGRSPSPLTESGQAQAREAGQWFRERSLDCIISSPLDRARDTAAAIAEAAGIREVGIAEELTEIDIGIFTSMRLEEVRARYPSEYAAFLRESWEGVPDAERIDALYARAVAAWDRLFERFAAGRRNILAVTHSGFLQWIIRSTLGLKSWMPLFNASNNCCVSHMLVDNVPPEQPAREPRSLYASWMLVNASVISSSR
jgi:broad specificity phosphatase PhoE